MYMLGRLTTAIALAGVQPTLVILVVGAAPRLRWCHTSSFAAIAPWRWCSFRWPAWCSVRSFPRSLLFSSDMCLCSFIAGPLAFFLIGGVGWTIIPMLIGAYAKRTSMPAQLVIALGAAIGLSVFALLLFLRPVSRRRAALHLDRLS